MDTTQNDIAATRHYTVSAVYDDNCQRYATSGEVSNPTEAAALAIFNANTDNKCSEPITIFAIFEGEHECMDIYVSQADERPKYVPSRAKKMLPFTVVRDFSVDHCDAQNARIAEHACAYEDQQVSGVFAGHLTNLLDQVDFTEAKRLAAEWQKENEAELAVLLAPRQPGAQATASM